MAVKRAFRTVSLPPAPVLEEYRTGRIDKQHERDLICSHIVERWCGGSLDAAAPRGWNRGRTPVPRYAASTGSR